MKSFEKLHQLKQSIWYDNIERRLLENGEMEAMINNGEIRGVTSNPSIFQKAIANSKDYDEALTPMAWSDWSAEDIFFQLAVEDIRKTADLFQDLYKKSQKNDGYVSLEVNPKIAYDAEKTIQQAIHLWDWVNRKNLMIKIPATKEGLGAIRKAIAAGINVNVTLIFSVERYAEVIDAYLSGLEDRVSAGLPINDIHSVASFFVSRVDSLIDKNLESLKKDGKITQSQLESLSGKSGIANSKKAYQIFLEKFNHKRFHNLQNNGANLQRPLWASTSTKNPSYSDVMYVEELIGENTVNTMPPQTLEAFIEHGQAELTITNGLDEVDDLFVNLESLGILMRDVTQKLEDDGIKAFEDAFSSMLDTIDERKAEIQGSLLLLKNDLKKNINQLSTNYSVARVYEKDVTFWTEQPENQSEIKNRLGWLDAPYLARELIEDLESFRDQVIDEGFSNVLLLGMGGSSLAAEVIALSFKGETDGLELNILDSTDPRQVKEAENISPVEKTLFLVSSKSGSTSEVQAFLMYFYNLVENKIGPDKVGQHFVAITDPDTSLEKQAITLKFRKVFNADPNVGGRYSALTMFGLVPAVLLGVDLRTYLSRAVKFSDQLRPDIPYGRNPGLVLGAILGTAFERGLDKLTVLAEEPYRSFGSWMEQLIAESSGKFGKGIIPVDIEPLISGKDYSKDRLFVYLKNDGLFSDFVAELISKGYPVITFNIKTPYELGAEFLRWEFATAIACAMMGINAFDQPDVQDNKIRTKSKLSGYESTQSLDEDLSKFENEKYKLFWGPRYQNLSVSSVDDLFDEVMASVQPGDYVAINAYLPRNPDTLAQLQALRKKVIDKTQSATTLGFGPRFLHSTGQLHKGGADNAVFIQITQDANFELPIPGLNYPFNVLEKAQALGDYEALLSRNRRVVRIHLKNASVKDLI